MTHAHDNVVAEPAQKKGRRWRIVLTSIIGALLVLGVIVAFVNPVNVYVQLRGDREVSVKYGEKYTDPGAAAFLGAQFFPRHITNLSVRQSGEVNTEAIGDYDVTYSADWLFLSGSATRHVRVVDGTPPELKLEGDSHIAIEAGQSFKDPGYHAQDAIDGDLTGKVAVSGTVDSLTVGDYTLTYSVDDGAGNHSEVTRTVTVVPVRQHAEVNPGHKVVYLTFDDGPSKYTSKLLDVLKSHNVHATFFVTGAGDPTLIKRAASEGNAIGVHTLTHDYSKIYSSKDAYLKDFNAMNDVIEKETGKRAQIFRFPGGSSNTVSKTVPGIMTKLSTDMQNLGYKYFDWNVTSGDAGEVTTTEAVYDNVVSGISQHDVSVVLQHDSHEFSVDAVDKIITWGLTHGYTFLPLDVTSPGMHHPIAN